MTNGSSCTISCRSRSGAFAATALHLFGLRYWDDVLSPWAGRLDRRLRVKYDPRDLSRVFVEGPDGAHWPATFADLRASAHIAWASTAEPWPRCGRGAFGSPTSS